MNQYNQVTVPQLALMNAIMTAMQPQPQLQSAGGVPNTINGLTVPQQAAFPNFVLQAPQLQAQAIPGSSSIPQLGGHPWVLPALQTANAPQPSGSQSNAPTKQPTVDEIVAGVVAAMKASTPQETALSDNSEVAVRFAQDDERILVNALRKAKAEGLTPLQGISKLDQVNNHTTAAWKDYFLKHVERLAPRVYPQAYANPPASISTKSVASGSRSTYTSGGPSASFSLPRRPITGGNASDSEKSTPDEDAVVGGTANHRSKRGAPVVEYHEETRIPHLPPGIKPMAPRRDSQHGNLRFTKEDKIFFIHYLKYRLRKGPVPSKEQLYRELAEQAPHHNADSWKRHWDNACRLPNEIYIQARKRVNSSQQEPLRRPRPQQNSSPLAESSEEEDDSGDEQEEGDGTPAELSDDPVHEPPVSRTPASTANKAKGGRGPRRCKISDEDIRAMAQYIVEKRKCDGWEALKAPIRWEEFASRPENKKRRLTAWIGITYTRAKDIQAYIQEYEPEQASTSPAEEKPSGSPTIDRTDLRPGDSKDRRMKGAAPSAKRGLEDEEPKSEGSRSSTQKRPKLAEPEAIVISD